MASNVNPNNIDGTYPVAGQDNDSQGFRTNFTNIKNNFVYTKSEIEDLQAKAVLKTALTGTTIDNNMSGTIFRSAEVRDIRESRVDLGAISGTIILDHTTAPYYVASTTGNLELSFAGFPAAGRVGRIRLEVTITDTVDTVILPSNVTYGTQGLAGFDGVDTISFFATGTYIFEFVTENGGTDVHIEDLSRARTLFHSEEIQLQQRTPAAGGRAGDKAGMIAVDDGYIYVCTNDYDGSSTLIWKRVALSPYS
jgi:hypothetical protein